MTRTNMKRVAFVLLLVLTMAVPVYAQQTGVMSPTSKRCFGPSGDLLIGDTVFLRPAGILAMGVGAAMSIVSFPFAAMTNSVDRLGQKYFVEPDEYTFVRPLGDVDYSCDEDMTIRY
jgi:hypothetical protein